MKAMILIGAPIAVAATFFVESDWYTLVALLLAIVALVISAVELARYLAA